MYLGDKKVSDDALLSFLIRNERYIEFVDKLAKNNAVTPRLTELIFSNIRKLGIEKSSINKWEKLLEREYSNQLHAEWSDGNLCIEGIKNGRYELIELTDELLRGKRTQNVFGLMDSNLGKVFDYGLKSLDSSSISIYEVMKEFDKYEPKDLKRYKGLGQMSANDLDETCMNLENQVCERVTWGDVDQAIRTMTSWHSRKPKHVAERKILMSKYIPDIKEIDT